MNYKKLKQQNRNNRALYETYYDLYRIAVKELEAKYLQVNHLINSLAELQVLADEKVNHELISKVISNTIDRHNLDKLINNQL